MTEIPRVAVTSSMRTASRNVRSRRSPVVIKLPQSRTNDGTGTSVKVDRRHNQRRSRQARRERHLILPPKRRKLILMIFIRLGVRLVVKRLHGAAPSNLWLVLIRATAHVNAENF